MDIAVLGIDLGKISCSIVGLDLSGKVVLRRRMQRKTIVTSAAKLSPCIIAMEACCGAQDADTGRARGPTDIEPRQHPARSVATRSSRTSSFQHRCRRARRQDGAYCLGAAATWQHVRAPSDYRLI